jgi:uncharacterized protein (DUF169 family)
MTHNLRQTMAGLNLAHLPVALAFINEPPESLPHIDRTRPAGCSFWKLASEGQAFYTEPADHEGCPIGAFTHGVALGPAAAGQLQSLIGTMIELKYLRSEEVPGIPHREAPMKYVAYAPVDRARFEPDVVIVRGTARQIMIVAEAARAAGVFDGGATMGRPACAMVPQVATSSAGVMSLGCIGNRVYTGLADNELYFALPGASAARVFEQVETMLAANAALETFHRQRAAV